MSTATGERQQDGIRRRLWAAQAKYAPYLFVSPFVVLFCAFLLYPLLRSLYMSVHQYAGSQSRVVAGRNFAFVLRDETFWLSVANTVGYTFAFLLFQIPAALGLALLLNGPRVVGRNLFRFAFFAPHLVGQVFVAVIFGLMLSRNGPLNSLLRVVWPSLEINWISDPWMARPAVVLASMWLSVGFGMIYFLAALQSVDKELYEAADVDGAGKWSQFRHVTLPGIRPVLMFMILTGTIGGLQLFELPYVLFNGPGPGAAGLTIVAYLFAWVEIGELGTASATGWVLATVVIAIAIAQVRIMRRGARDEE